jgi:DNA repair exonuclease SbcCD nuclease subunit
VKTLLVGDPHVTVDELGDCAVLLGLVSKTAEEQNCDEVLFLGDLHNNFAVTNVRVTAFWRTALKHLASRFRVTALVGNHDMLGNGMRTPHALVPYEDIITVISEPIYFMNDKTIYLPYIADPNLFLTYVADHPQAERIICHQEFNGAVYDNGFYSPHGIDPNLMQVPVISGHIHTPQTLGNVWYPGAPRWRTLSDAGTKERFLHTVSSTGATSAHPTSQWVKRICEINITPETAHIVHLFANKDEYRIHVEGPADFVKEQLAKLAEYEEANKRVSSTITDSRVVRVKESDGIETAFHKYAEAFKPKNATPADKLIELAANRL